MKAIYSFFFFPDENSHLSHYLATKTIININENVDEEEELTEAFVKFELQSDNKNNTRPNPYLLSDYFKHVNNYNFNDSDLKFGGATYTMPPRGRCDVCDDPN